LALVNWNHSQKEAFLRSQFYLQDQFYKKNYPGAQFQVILMNGQPIGRFYVHRRNAEIRVMDIALIPEFRGKGIGSALLKEIFAEATLNNLPVTIHVERFNPAMHLYERLGFCLAEERGVYNFMVWQPPSEKEENVTTGSTAKQ
jgi:GNAT superfamily N-acetyltransferase